MKCYLPAEAQRRRLIQTAGTALLFLFAAHAFCFFNLTYSAGSVMINVNLNTDSQIVSGQFLQPLYWRVRGALSAPLLVGLLSTLYLTAAILCLCDLLKIESKAARFALCGTLTVNAAVLSLCAGSLHTADAAFLSLLLAVAGVCFCLRMGLCMLPGVLCLFLSMGLDAHAPAVAVSLTLIVLVQGLLRNENGKLLLRRALCALTALLLGTVLYAAGYLFMLHHEGLTPEAVLQPAAGGSLLEVWLYPIRALFAPLTAYATLNVLLRTLLLLLGGIVLLRLLGKKSLWRALTLVLLVLALPLSVNLPVFAVTGTGQTSLPFAFLDVLLIVLLCEGLSLLPASKALAHAAAGAFGVLFLGMIVFSNQVYTKKNLEFQSTLSVMTRVVNRIEETEGYQTAATPVALIGNVNDSTLSVSRPGFEHLSLLDAAAGNYASASASDNIWYMWEVMGYPLNLVSLFEQEQLASLDIVKAMPVFPAAGCCQMVEGTLVVKLSE